MPTPVTRPVDITILVTDAQLNVVGDPIYCWDNLDVTLRFNEVSSGQFTAPAYPWLREQLAAGRRIVVVRNGRVLIAGPIEGKLVEQSDDGENAGVGKLTVKFADDLSLVAYRGAYPNPAVAPDAQDRDVWAYNGPAEQVLQDLVNVNAGPGALAARRVPRLMMAGTSGVSPTVAGSIERLQPLGEAMRSIAVAGGGRGFRTSQTMNTKQILFQTYTPRDLSNLVRFSFGLGNLRYLGYEESAPRATTVIVGGQGEGADRFLTSRTNTAVETEWGRRESYLARPGNDPLPELQQAADEELSQAASTSRLQSSAWDSDDQRYGEHYDLGDRVGVEVGPAEVVTDVVRLVHLQAWSTANELVSAMVGAQDAVNNRAMVARMRQLDRRLGQVERRAVPSARTVA